MGAEFIKKWGLFFVVMFLVILIAYMFFYDSVQREVKAKSRCIREKAATLTGGAYAVYAKNKNNDSMYKVTYKVTGDDRRHPNVSIECNCAPGETNNTFSGIKYYQNGSVYDGGSKVCGCDRNLVADGGDTLYSGAPHLVDFMSNGTTSWFENTQ